MAEVAEEEDRTGRDNSLDVSCSRGRKAEGSGNLGVESISDDARMLAARLAERTRYDSSYLVTRGLFMNPFSTSSTSINFLSVHFHD